MRKLGSKFKIQNQIQLYYLTNSSSKRHIFVFRGLSCLSQMLVSRHGGQTTDARLMIKVDHRMNRSHLIDANRLAVLTTFSCHRLPDSE